MEWIRFVITAVLVLAGLFFCCVGVLGLFRFKYAANRMHAAAVVDTLGISLCMAGFAVSAPDLFSGLKILLVIVCVVMSVIILMQEGKNNGLGRVVEK